jgi:phenylacetate-CoA ligase
MVIPLWAKWERSNYLTHLEHLNKSQYFSKEKVREYQWQKLQEILSHAYEYCKFYRKKFDKQGINPAEVRSIEDFSSIPVLSKDEVRASRDELFVPNSDRYIRFLTSGSTGKPLSGYWNKDCSDLKRACGIRSNLWAGYEFGEPMYCLYGNPEKELKGLRRARSKLRRKLLQRTEILDLLQLSEESMLKLADLMRRKPPSILWGHAHGLFLLARFFEKKGIRDIKPKGMYSAGMVLHHFQRKKVEEIFTCKLQDRYGCEELGLIAAECKEQRGLHINTDALYVEFLGKDGKHVNAGDRGHIVITDLANKVMPFIRYKLEDICIPSGKVCSCGRTQPMIESIEGRTADFLIKPTGELVSGISLTDHFAGHVPGVLQIQLIQEQLDLLRLNIVKDASFDRRSVDRITMLVRDFFGEGMNFETVFMEDIPQESSGKYRFTICKVDHELLQ